MKMAVLVLFLFGVFVGVATFIENDYGTQTAQALIYKARWFEIFLAYFVAILTYQIFKYKSYKNRLPVFIFHFSFIIIAFGALITRYVGYEGIMHIREGQATNKMVSDVKSLQLFAQNAENNASLEKVLYFSTMTKNSLSQSVSVGDKEVNVELIKYLPTFTQEVLADPNGSKILELKVSANGEGKIYFFKYGKVKDFGTFYVAYNAKNALEDKPTFNIADSNGTLRVQFPYILKTLNMETKESEELKSGDNVFAEDYFTSLVPMP